MPTLSEKFAITVDDPQQAAHKRAELSGRFEDAEWYIDKFLRFTGALVAPELEAVKFQPERFAVIKASGGIAENEAELHAFAETVATLQAVGLPTTIVHGAGNQIDAKLRAKGVISEKNPDGTRITPAKDMWAVEAALQDVGDTLEAALIDQGATVKRPSGLFTVEISNPEDMGSVDKVSHVDTEAIQESIHDGKIVLASSLGQLVLPSGGVSVANANADIVWTATAEALEPWKAISLTKQEGILDADGELISSLTSEEALEMIDAGDANGGAVIKLRAAIELARNHIIDDVVVTNVAKLPQELYTAKGGGTDIHA